MKKVRIIVDSTADVTEDIKKQLKIVPLTVHFGEEEFVDGVSLTYKEFYERLIESDTLPTTSQASPAAFSEVFEEIVKAGESAVVITISAKLSGTYQSAMIAAGDYPDDIYVVDSNTAAIGSGILAKLALQLAESGMPAGEIAERLMRERDNICLVALLDTLEYLQLGGRISKTAAFAGGILNIKPVISIRDGEVVVLGKARGSKHGNNLLVSEIQKAGGVDFDRPILLGYSGLSDILIHKYIEDSKALWEGNVDELKITCIGSVIGTHAGPGAIAVAFFKKTM